MLQPVLYSSNNNFAKQCARIVVNKYRDIIKWNKKPSILEVGVGDGRTSAEVLFPSLFPKDYDKYVGTDKSVIMIDHAKKLLPVKNTDFFELDIFQEVEPELHNKFDCVVSFLTLHWGSDTRKAAENIYKMLKPGGQTLNVTFTEAPNDEAYEKLSKNPKWSNFDHKTLLTPYYKNCQAAEQYKRDFEKAGFKDCWVKKEQFIYKFANKKEYENLYESLNRIKSKVPKNLVRDYLNDYFNALRESRLWFVTNVEDGDENVEIIGRIMAGYGRK